ncbi:MAG: DUF1799 domain-containing protein [Candidatus Thiodiazotropha sp. (ex Epidulcina cf. delphinae)]|nr:DUF1799 domain-containing protein [Candidatus Thiodiazotropha sp. (ex Epidulcina cf. delphinae)]
MAACRASQERIETEIAKLNQAESQSEDTEFTVYFDNWKAWEIFRRVNTQFILNHFSGRAISLDYSAVTSVISLFDVDDRLELFDAVRLIERGYLDNLPD